MADERWVPPGGGDRNEGQAAPAGYPPQGYPPQPGYPPQQPGYPEYGGYLPAPPGASRSGGRVLVVVLGVIVLVLVLVGGGLAALVVLSDDEDEPVAEPVPIGDAEVEPFQHPGGDYALSVPAGWVSTPVEGDVSALGAQAFPDDAEAAGRLQSMVDALPRVIVFVSVDPEALVSRSFVDNINLVRLDVPGTPGLDQVEAEARLGIEAFGGSPTSEGRYMTAGGEAVRIEYDVPAVPGVGGVQYHLPLDGNVWTLTFSSDDMEANMGLADAVAADLSPSTSPS